MRTSTAAAPAHGRLPLLGLLEGELALAEQCYPRKKQVSGRRVAGADTAGDEWQTTGVHWEKFAAGLMAAAAAKGHFKTAAKVRETGAWRGANGELILHCGDQLMIGRQWRACGEYDGLVYPRSTAMDHPSDILALGGFRPAADLLRLFSHWNWQRPEVAPHLLLGWTAAAVVGGALLWRPSICITGSPAAGKSTLVRRLLKTVFGPGGALIYEDMTAAGVAQSVGHSSRPIILDELEAEGDGQRGAMC